MNWFAGHEHVVAALGWALVHSLWQGALVAAVLWGALATCRRSAPALRYALACGALATLPALFAATFALGLVHAPADPQATVVIPMPEPSSAVAGEPAGSSAAAPPAGANVAPAPRTSLAERTDALLPWLVGCWCLGVLVFQARLVGSWLYAQRLRWKMVAPVEERIRRLLEEQAGRLGVWKPVWVLESRAVAVPMLIGWLRPLILLPADAVRRLGETELAAILAHELAHVRRHDYIVNLFQSFVEALLFHHPCVWWISARIREERENCCDDIALSVCDRTEYARALLQVEELRGDFLRGAALAASGGSLLDRVARMAAAHVPRTPRPALSTLLVLAVLGMALRPEARSDGLPADPDFHRAINRRISVSLENVSVADATAEISRLTGLRVEAPADAAGDPVSLYFEDVEADVVWQCLFNLKEMDWNEDAATRTVRATWWPGSGPTPGVHRTISLPTFHARQRLFQNFGHEVGWFELRNEPVAKGLNDLYVLVGIDFEYEPAIGELLVSIDLRNTTVRGALIAMLKVHGLVHEYTDDGGVLVRRP